MSETDTSAPAPSVFAQLLAKAGIAVVGECTTADGTVNVTINPGDTAKACRFLKDDAGAKLDLLLSVTGIDRQDCIEVQYHLYSTTLAKNLVLRARLDRQVPQVESVIAVHPGAAYHEREGFDMFGIKFLNHAGLKRILLPHDWIGHPLRKDYVQNDPRLSWNQR